MTSISTQFNGQLDTQYLQMINSLMEIERQPLMRLQEQRDNYNVRKGIYEDLKGSLEKLQASTKALVSTDAAYSFSTGRKVSIQAGEGSSVVTASASSDAALSSYTIHINSLAKAHQVMSAQQSSMTAALNLAGTITVGGVNLEVLSSDSLANIANKINNATYETGHAVVATVIDARLVISAKNTGEDFSVTASDTAGSVLQTLGVLGNDGSTFLNEIAAANARFTINDLPEITRSSNIGLTDVIHGVTLNFSPDAVGKDATINIQADNKKETDAFDTFIKDFNSLTTYLEAKLSTKKQADGTYKRGSLAGDNSLYSLRLDLLRQLNTNVANDGTYKNLAQIGISIDNSMNLTISNSSDFSKALQTDKANVTKLMDAMMTKINTLLGRFTGTDGYVKTLSKSIEQQVKQTNSQIDQMQSRLDAKKASLYNQFAQAQAQITEMIYTQQRLAALYNSGGSY